MRPSSRQLCQPAHLQKILLAASEQAQLPFYQEKTPQLIHTAVQRTRPPSPLSSAYISVAEQRHDEGPKPHVRNLKENETTYLAPEAQTCPAFVPVLNPLDPEAQTCPALVPVLNPVVPEAQTCPALASVLASLSPTLERCLGGLFSG